MKASASGVLASKRPRPGNRRFRTTAVARVAQVEQAEGHDVEHHEARRQPRAHGSPAADRSRKGDGDGALARGVRERRRSSTTPATTRPARGTRTAARSSQPAAVGEDQDGRVRGSRWRGGRRGARASSRPRHGDGGPITGDLWAPEELGLQGHEHVHDRSMLRITAVPPAPAAGRAGPPR